jgi:hypothetical protein
MFVLVIGKFYLLDVGYACRLGFLLRIVALDTT